MNTFFKFTSVSAALLLAACGSESSNTGKAQEAAKETETVASSASKDVAKKAKEAVAKVVENLKLDTSSMEAFTSSLSNMKASLSSDQKDQLTDAISSLAKDAAGEKGGLLGAAKGLASGKSTEEVVYEKLASKHDGLTFDDILALTK